MMCDVTISGVRMVRPIGVTIIAICCFLAALYDTVNDIQLLARGDFMAIFSHEGAPNDLAKLGAAFILNMITFTALHALAGWGLWKLRVWGRWITIFLVANGIAFTSLRWFLTPHHKTSDFITITITFVIDVVIVWYLLKDDIRTVFAASYA
jgi:Predicted membrane protein (DUF2127)